MYNGLMERVVTQDPALRMTQLQWCRCGQLRRFVDGNGNITEWQRDERSRVTKKIHSNGSFETYAYDFSGRLVSEVDPLSRTVTYEYTVDDRVSKKDFSDAETADVLYTYDPYFPRVATRQDGAGTTSFTYHPYGASTNGAGQVALVNGPLSNDTQKHTYDELGRLKKLEIVDDATQSVASYAEEYTFDARSRVSAVANNLGNTTYSFVGQSNRPSTVGYANGMQTLYDYFGATGDFLLKQIKHISAGPNPSVISQFDYTYRADRSIATWMVDQGSGSNTWAFGYDAARELTSATLRDGSQTLLESHTYGYDKAGNRIQVGNGTSAPRNYEVNNLNQLLSERDHGRTTFAGQVDEAATVKVNGTPAKVFSTDGGAPFRFEALVDLDAGANTVTIEARDGNDNVATKTYSVTTTGTSKTYEYDANGNLRYEKLPGGTVVREYRWDQQNRLVRMLQGTHESLYEYDGESRRVRIKELTSSVESKNETFVWCGARICQKRASNGSTVVRNYFDQGFEEGTSDYFYTRDHLGSVREVVGSDGTSVSGGVTYSPWGESTEIGTVLPDFGYTGHYVDRSSGLALARYRGYSPNLGRWMSRDPMGIRGGLNLYGYVNNGPLTFVDPDGRYAVAAAPIAIEIGVAVYFAYYLLGPKSGPTLGPKPGPGGPGPEGPGPGGPGPGPGGGGGGPYRDLPPGPGPQYPECSGMSIAATNTCCRQATGYRGDLDGDECNPARQNYDDCMSENGW